MPKQTFFNLPEEKRNKIIECAIEEFSQSTFKNASVTKIAENSGIAKGSVYQYFEDKKELYKYMIDLAGQKKLEYFQDCMAQLHNIHFIELIRQLYIKGIQFAHDNPKLAAVANNFVKETDIALKEEILGMSLEKSNQFFEHLIDAAKLKGEINPDIDTKIGAYMITTVNASLVDYLLNIRKHESLMDQSREIMDFADKMLFIIEKGFEKR